MQILMFINLFGEEKTLHAESSGQKLNQSFRCKNARRIFKVLRCGEFILNGATLGMSGNLLRVTQLL